MRQSMTGQRKKKKHNLSMLENGPPSVKENKLERRIPALGSDFKGQRDESESAVVKVRPTRI